MSDTEAIAESAVLPSIPESIVQEAGFTNNNYGSGAQDNAQGVYVARGSARQYNSAGGAMYFGIQEIRDQIEEIHFSKEESKCFETLRTSNYLARKDLNPERLHGTCKWFLDHPKYQGWTAQNPTSRLLWVSADPGCGKSVLAKAAAHATCAILHQICDLRPILIKYILPIYRRNGQKMVDLFEDLWSAFTDIISDKAFGNVICILDAIDECSDDDSKKLLQRLAAISTSSTSIKILITSRPYTWIETALFHKTGLDKNEIRLSGEGREEQNIIEKEIGFFIAFRVQDFRELRESKGIYDDAHENLQSHLNDIKNRTYLWVSAVFSELERDVCAPEYILMEIIKALPENVDTAYENILKKTPANKKLILKKVLHIMLVAFRPLSLIEMNVVLSVQETSSGPRYSNLYPEHSFQTWLRDLCGFFISIVDSKLYFAHQTVREFLIGEEGYQPATAWKGSFPLADSHTVLARICINYLLLMYDGSLDGTFHDYALICWPEHCQSLELDQSLADKVNSFIFQNSSVAPSFVRWTIAMNDFIQHNRFFSFSHRIRRSISSSATPLFLACYFGWPSVIVVLKTYSDVDWNEKTKEKETGLQIAAREGHVEIVKLLLDAGADVNIQSHNGEAALHYAAQLPYLCPWTLNPFSQRHLGFEARLLLMAGADVDTPDEFQQTALHLPAKKEHPEIAKLLLEAGAHVNIQNSSGKTPLYPAAEKGHLEAVKLLLNAGADVNIQHSSGETPLHRAAEGGSLETVKLLLNAGADVNTRSYVQETALHNTAGRGHVEIVKLLLAAGAHVNIQSSNGQTPLHAAAERGHLETVKLLLNAGAGVNIQNSYGETPLYLAAGGRYPETVKLLVSAAADVNIQNFYGETPLHRAAGNGDLETVKLLVSAGVDVNVVDTYGKKAFHLAEGQNCVQIVETLLAAGAIDSS